MLSARLITLFFVGLFLSLQSFAFKVPNLSGPVIDEPGLLSTNAKANLDQTIRELKQRNGPQVQVFVTSSLQDEEIASVAIQIFDQWKLGDAKKSNGILFLIAPAEKKMRIEVGQGLEGDLPDVIAKRIISDVVSPYFKRKEYDYGVLQGVAAIIHYIDATPEQKAELQQQESNRSRGSGGVGLLGFLLNHNPLLILFLLFAVIKIISSLFGGGGRGGGGFYGGFGGGGFGSGGGGGSWGGGGGSSSGGGASGDW